MDSDKMTVPHSQYNLRIILQKIIIIIIIYHLNTMYNLSIISPLLLQIQLASSHPPADVVARIVVAANLVVYWLKIVLLCSMLTLFSLHSSNSITGDHT